MLKVQAIRIAARKQEQTSREKAFFQMGCIQTLCQLEDLFNKSAMPGAKHIATMLAIKANRHRKHLRKIHI